MTESVSGTELLVTIKPSFILSSFAYIVVGWPGGLRRCVKAAVSSDAWVRIPLLSIFLKTTFGVEYLLALCISGPIFPTGFFKTCLSFSLVQYK